MKKNSYILITFQKIIFLSVRNLKVRWAEVRPTSLHPTRSGPSYSSKSVTGYRIREIRARIFGILSDLFGIPNSGHEFSSRIRVRSGRPKPDSGHDCFSPLLKLARLSNNGLNAFSVFDLAIPMLGRDYLTIHQMVGPNYMTILDDRTRPSTVWMVDAAQPKVFPILMRLRTFHTLQSVHTFWTALLF